MDEDNNIYTKTGEYIGTANDFSDNDDKAS